MKNNSKKLKEELSDRLKNPNSPPKFYRITETQMSIARHYGGIIYNGRNYFYNPKDDTLTREDIWKKEIAESCKKKKVKFSCKPHEFGYMFE